eukprot:m.288946 g.288946  ORF g.288946 m.288946 type:complete len:1551 (-) comp17791_c0_seq4:905-5557(-)
MGAAARYTDGMVFGPFPNKTVAFNLKLDYLVNIDYIRLATWNTSANDIGFVALSKAKIMNDGIQVVVERIVDYCARQGTSCGECTIDPACGWCDGLGCLPADSMATCNQAWTPPGSCCSDCLTATTCGACANLDGCGWDYETAQCLSGSSKQACQPSQTFNFEDETCSIPPGTILTNDNIINSTQSQLLSIAVDEWCSGHGNLDYTTMKCACDAGYFGLGCEGTCPGGVNNVCNGHGQCDELVGQCRCNCGYDGDACQNTGCPCDENATMCTVGPTCQLTCGTRLLDDTCSGYLDVLPDPNGRYATGSSCGCAEGHWGSFCNNTCPGVGQGGEPCGGLGQCDPTTGVCQCDPCHQLDMQEGICVEKTQPTCIFGQPKCSILSNNFECTCPGGRTGPLCATCGCLNGGTCNSITQQCQCINGFSGQYCQINCTRDDRCSGHGECNRESITCECDEGYAGSDCSVPCNATTDCNGRGTCNPLSGKCSCIGFSGPNCQTPIDACASSPCGMHRVCTDKPTPAGAGPEGRTCSQCTDGMMAFSLLDVCQPPLDYAETLVEMLTMEPEHIELVRIWDDLEAASTQLESSKKDKVIEAAIGFTIPYLEQANSSVLTALVPKIVIQHKYNPSNFEALFTALTENEIATQSGVLFSMRVALDASAALHVSNVTRSLHLNEILSVAEYSVYSEGNVYGLQAVAAATKRMGSLPLPEQRLFTYLDQALSHLSTGSDTATAAAVVTLIEAALPAATQAQDFLSLVSIVEGQSQLCHNNPICSKLITPLDLATPLYTLWQLMLYPSCWDVAVGAHALLNVTKAQPALTDTEIESTLLFLNSLTADPCLSETETYQVLLADTTIALGARLQPGQLARVNATTSLTPASVLNISFGSAGLPLSKQLKQMSLLLAASKDMLPSDIDLSNSLLDNALDQCATSNCNYTALLPAVFGAFQSRSKFYKNTGKSDYVSPVSDLVDMAAGTFRTMNLTDVITTNDEEIGCMSLQYANDDDGISSNSSCASDQVSFTLPKLPRTTSMLGNASIPGHTAIIVMVSPDHAMFPADVEMDASIVTLKLSTSNESIALEEPLSLDFSLDTLASAISELFPAGDDDDANSTIVPSLNTSTFTVGGSSELLEALCVWYDVANKTWDTSGCTTVLTSTGSITCECTHLTSFSVLVQPSSTTDGSLSSADSAALSVITYVGLSLSIVCLVLVLVAFFLLRNTKYFSFRQRITANQVIALLLAQLIFIGGIQATADRVACEAVAALLHFLWLVVLFWSAAEAHHIYMNFVKVLGVGVSNERRFRWYFLSSWLGGLVVMLIGVMSSIDDYGSEDVCWIQSGAPVIWAFLAPLIVVMTFNLLVIIKASTSVSAHHGKGLAVKTFGIFALLLGVTWVFGIMMLALPTEVALHYLFAITNTLQGVYIFLIQAYINKDRREVIKEQFHRSIGNSHVRSGTRQTHVSKHEGSQSASKGNSKDNYSTRHAEELLFHDGYLVIGDDTRGDESVATAEINVGQLSRGSIFKHDSEAKQAVLVGWQQLIGGEGNIPPLVTSSEVSIGTIV